MEDVPESKDFSFPRSEEATLSWWDSVDAFEEQLRRTEGGKPFVFYDGPPFATGLPHYGHLLAGTIKVCFFLSFFLTLFFLSLFLSLSFLFFSFLFSLCSALERSERRGPRNCGIGFSPSRFFVLSFDPPHPRKRKRAKKLTFSFLSL